MRRYEPVGIATILGLLIAACARTSSSPASDAEAYQAVLTALQDSLGTAPIWVQPNPVLVGDYTSAPGDRPEHFVSHASGAIAEAVASNTSQWNLCSELGGACLSRPARGVALSELRAQGADTWTVWVTYSELFSEGHHPPWQILYYRVTLHLSKRRWLAGAPVLLGGEP